MTISPPWSLPCFPSPPPPPAPAPPAPAPPAPAPAPPSSSSLHVSQSLLTPLSHPSVSSCRRNRRPPVSGPVTWQADEQATRADEQAYQGTCLHAAAWKHPSTPVPRFINLLLIILVPWDASWRNSIRKEKQCDTSTVCNYSIKRGIIMIERWLRCQSSCLFV